MGDCARELQKDSANSTDKTPSLKDTELTFVGCTTDSSRVHHLHRSPEYLIYFLLYRVFGHLYETPRSRHAEPFPSIPSTDLSRD